MLANLTERDRRICSLLHEHRVLTTAQLAEIEFDSISRAQTRLLALHQRGLLIRFRPHTPAGSAPWHYTLDRLGATLVAADRGQDLTGLGWRPEYALRYMTSQRLAHLLGTNSVFTALAAHARRGGGQLGLWWPERRCATAFAGLAHPDGYGQFTAGGRSVEFFLEYDTGSEPLSRLAGKLPGYTDLHAALRRPIWLLFYLPTPRREAATRRALAAATVPVATATPAGGTPAGPVWLPLREEGPRRPLAELAR